VLERVDGTVAARPARRAGRAGEGRRQRRARASALELVSNLVSIAEAMAYAHERRVVHRDITPNNILIGRRGEATLIDWGIAATRGHSAESAAHDEHELVGESGRAQTISAGTPPYVCFAQSQGYPAEPAFDVYSFGMTLYEVVAGKLPYAFKPDGTDEASATTSSSAFLDVGREGPARAAGGAARSGAVGHHRARHRRATTSNRFSADELLRALKQYLTGDLVFSHRYSASGRPSRWVRKHRGATVAMVLAAASIVAGTVIWLGVRAREATYAKERAQLGAQAVAAQMDAANKALTAEQAAAEAARMLSRAEAAERNGQDAQALRAAAEAKRLEAEAAAKTAAAAAAQAATDASNAKAESDAALASAHRPRRGRPGSTGRAPAAACPRSGVRDARAALREDHGGRHHRRHLGRVVQRPRRQLGRPAGHLLHRGAHEAHQRLGSNGRGVMCRSGLQLTATWCLRAARWAARRASASMRASTLASSARRSIEISVDPGTAVTKLGSTLTTPQVATTRAARGLARVLLG
jgi:hypothetical protein